MRKLHNGSTYFSNKNPEGWTVKIGHTRRIAYSKHRQVKTTRAIIPFPYFDMDIVDSDLALIQLSSPVTLGDYVRPICLPGKDDVMKPGTRCIAAGWGKNSQTGWFLLL